MNIEDHDNIIVPDNLNEYIDRGINKGINYKLNYKPKYINIKKAASVAIISTITLTAASNIPAFASELVNIPVIGKLVKVLDFKKTSKDDLSGGVITDGNRLIVDSQSNKSINFFFTNNGKLINTIPHYNVEYRKYPHTLVVKFEGVRNIDKVSIEKNVKNIPYVKDVYEILTLDDSMVRIAIELDESISFKVSEYKDPGMMQVKVDGMKDNMKNTVKYFIRTKEMKNNEEMSNMEEKLNEYGNAQIQKVKDDVFILQFGPFDYKKEAEEKLDEIKSKIKEINILDTEQGNDENINKDEYKLHIEERSIGNGPKLHENK